MSTTAAKVWALKVASALTIGFALSFGYAVLKAHSGEAAASEEIKTRVWFDLPVAIVSSVALFAGYMLYLLIDQRNELRRQVSALLTMNNETKKTEAALRAHLEEVKTDKGNLEARIQGFETAIANLRDRLAAHESRAGYAAADHVKAMRTAVSHLAHKGLRIASERPFPEEQALAVVAELLPLVEEGLCAPTVTGFSAPLHNLTDPAHDPRQNPMSNRFHYAMTTISEGIEQITADSLTPSYDAIAARERIMRSASRTSCHPSP